MSDVDCEQVLREVELYVDGELSEPERTEVEEHLSGCGSCLDRTEFRQRLKEVVGRKCSGEGVPPALASRILDRLDRESGA